MLANHLSDNENKTHRRRMERWYMFLQANPDIDEVGFPANRRLDMSFVLIAVLKPITSV